MSSTNGPLAILGGAPRFAQPVHVGRPNIPDVDRLMQRFREVLDRRWLTNDGPLVHEFERCIREHVGVKHCIAMCNGTVALEIAIRSLELKGEVIVPSFTFVATAHALQWQQITPVFADIAPDGHNIDPSRVERHITPRTTGILATHVWGRSCAVEQLQDIADRRGLKLMFDSAHAFGCSHAGKMIGGFGDAEVFSFHATKFMNSAEGGAVVTNDDQLAERIRLMRNFGFVGYDDVDYVGTNGKMSELSAAMGLTSFESIADVIAVNRRNYEAYKKLLATVPGIRVESYPDHESSNYQYVVAEISSDSCGLTRDELVAVLHRENVLVRRYFSPGCHRHEPYSSFFPFSGLLLPETERVSERVMQFPTGTGISIAEIESIVDIVRTAIHNAPAIKKVLSST